jgi:hypothetical protein
MVAGGNKAAIIMGGLALPAATVEVDDAPAQKVD